MGATTPNLDVLTSRASQALSELIIYGMVVFGPWAFGTTQPWSIWVINVLGYALVLLWAVDGLCQYLGGYRLPTWEDECRRAGAPSAHALTVALAASTIAILGFCLLSAVNARATYLPLERRFEYHACLNWLPHSLDSRSSWLAFWTYLGLACSFWAIWHWLLGKSPAEQVAHWGCWEGHRPPAFPDRLRRLLWLLAINGALLAAEGIAQRLTHCPRLLFLVQPQIHHTAETQFGPFAYRANAAQYFNLLWPVCLGFWWSLAGRESRGRLVHHLLLACVLLMALCPIMSGSRGGAFVCLGLVLATAFYWVASPGTSFSPTQVRNFGYGTNGWLLGLFFLSVPALGWALGWNALAPRLAQLREGIDGRERICAVARRIAQEFPIYGTGPGTYESVSELYRPDGPDFWPAQVHNDWLETRVTFGIVGSTLIATAIALVLLRPLASGGFYTGTTFVALTWLAVAGSLVHARFDFPFQVHSILFLFVVLGALLFTQSRGP